MSQTQRAVTEYLHSELIHSLGAYRATVNQLEILLAADPIEPLREVLDAAHKFNVQLHECRNHPDKALRHPIPERLPISGHTWGLDAAAPGRHWPDVLRRSDAVHRHKWLEPLDCVKYYDAAILAFTRRLDDYGDGDGAGEEAVDRAAEQFSDCLTARDPYVLEGHGIARRVLRARLVRYERRRESAVALLSRGHQMTTPPAESLLALREGSFQQPEDQSIPWFVIKAQAEAHLAMHVVEGIKSQPFGGIAALDAAAHDWLRDHLERCIVLQTFVYSVSRAAPWIFAEDDAERRWVYDNHATAFESVSPTRCMWIATQLALLSLSRRAFAYSLLPDRERAFNDYQKLQRLVRDTERRIQRTPVHVVGAPEFLVAVSSQAHQHAGEIYRAEHAHTRALDQFRAASLRMAPICQHPVMSEALQNSRWQIRLQVSRGKACYEMGRHKESLKWHLTAWRNFLVLLAGDTQTEATTGAVDAAIAWLDGIRLEPELRKPDALEYMRPVVAQLPMIAIERGLATLAAEVLLRLGHLIFILGLEGRAERGSVAELCLRKALECDPKRTLVRSNLMSMPATAFDGLGPAPPVEEQWPLGGDDYEHFARATEYLLISAAREMPADRAESRGQKVARELLGDFFIHTDSIDVRKSQSYRLLMRAANTTGAEDDASALPAIELVCMRRYSSAFPLLPRPSAFRALGGGYFIALHASASPPYGIVIDPGTDFVEQLYRVGRSIADINLIVVTHDHVDHCGGLDALLALFYERSLMINGRDRRRDSLAILGNASVVSRYAGTKDVAKHFDFVEVHAPSELDLTDYGAPGGFVMEAMSSESLDGIGHLDLGRAPSFGVCVRDEERRVAVAITSDVPEPCATGWEPSWDGALQADVLVSHLSTIPLTELRKLIGLGLDGHSTGQRARDEDTMLALYRALEQAGDVEKRGRLDYAFWLGSEAGQATPILGAAAGWTSPQAHGYLTGLMRWIAAYEGARVGRSGLFVIGELSEELGTLRGRIAARLNGRNGTHGAGEAVRALTADVGLHVIVSRASGQAADGTAEVRVACATCCADNDRVWVERMHPPGDIREVCIKGENEGLFYICKHHDPTGRTHGEPEDGRFLERLERFDVFGR